jgi:multidrug resistance efflux pump
MMTSPDERQAVAMVDALERPLAAVEHQLAALGLALHRQDMTAVDQAAAELHLALARAVDHFSRAARTGGAPMPLRRRLAMASGQVAAQREALARATASLDRAMDVLLPQAGVPGVASAARLYSAAGGAERAGQTGSSLLA